MREQLADASSERLVNIVRHVVEGAIDQYCRAVGIAKPTVLYSDSAFARHKEETHSEIRRTVLSDIRQALGGNGRALTCDHCFEVVLIRPQKVGLLEDPSRIETQITNMEDNIRFLLLHELLHVKLRDSELREYGDYHTPNFKVRFNEYASLLGVTRYKEKRTADS